MTDEIVHCAVSTAVTCSVVEAFWATVLGPVSAPAGAAPADTVAVAVGPAPHETLACPVIRRGPVANVSAPLAPYVPANPSSTTTARGSEACQLSVTTPL